MLISTNRFNTPRKKQIIIEAVLGALPQIGIVFLIYKSFHFQLIPELMSLALVALSLTGLIGYIQLAFSVANHSTLKRPFLTFLMVTMGCTISLWWLAGYIMRFPLWSLFGFLPVLASGHFTVLYLRNSEPKIIASSLVEAPIEKDDDTLNLDATEHPSGENAKAWSLPVLTIGVMAIAAKLFEMYGYFAFRTHRDFYLESLAVVNSIILPGYFIVIVAVIGKASKLRITFAVLILIMILVLTMLFGAVKAH